MLNLFPSAARVRPVAPWSPWSLLAAAAATLAAFLLVLSALLRRTPAPAPAGVVPVERLTWLTPRRLAGGEPVPAAIAVPARVGIPTRPAPSMAVDDSGTGAGGPPAMGGAGRVGVPTPGGVLPAGAAPALGEASSRLMPSRGSAPWTPPVVFDPFLERATPAPDVRDSLLRDLRDTVATVARSLVMTGARRDALIKEGMLHNRVSGRVLLDPVVGDGTYSGQPGNAIPVPFLEPGPSRAERVRDSISFAENRARLLRLRARADSLRAARRQPSP